MPIDFRKPQYFKEFRFGSTLVWGGINSVITTVTGISPLLLTNALNKSIKSLMQYGKCAQNGTPTPSSPVDIKCNNGAIRVSANLLDTTTVPDENKYITSHSGGESTPGSGTFRHSGYIRIVGGEEYCFGMKPYLASTAGLAWYSAPNLGSYISGVNGTTLKNTGMVATAPASANYVRFSWMTSSGYDTDWQNSVYICVNGLMSAFRAFGEVYIDGTPEVLTVSASGAETQTASVANLFAVGDYKDEQDIISGAVTRRCAVCLYDGTQSVGDTYLSTTGGKDNGAIIVYPKGTNYSGAIASFDFDEEDNELGALSVAIEPIQDLHGYDNPWPAGGGKNKFDSSLFDTPTVGNALVYTHYDVPNGTYTMSTPDFPLVSDIANVFFLTGAVTSGAKSSTNGVTTENSRTITVTDGHYTVVYRSSQSSNTNNPKDFKWQIESGSAPTAWTPFSNICPISGWTAANVTRTGKNLIPSIDDTAFWDTSGFFNKNGTITVRTNYKTSTYLPVIGGCQYVFSTFNENETIISGWKGLLVYDSNKQPLQDTFYENNATKIAITIPDEGSYIRMYTVLANNITYQQLELGATSTTYEPYTGNSYTIQLGDTVYGGTLDVTSGKLTVQWGIVDLGTLNWLTSSQNFFYTTLSGKKPGATNLICTNYKTKLRSHWAADELAISGNVNTAQLYIRDMSLQGETGAEFKTDMSGVQLCYEIATPIEITLTPTQISTLLGQNNVWSDAGEISVLVLEPTTESVTPQPLNTTKGTNIISATSNVDPIEFEIEYYKDE